MRILACIALCLLPAAMALAAAQNLVANGSFEQATKDPKIADNWDAPTGAGGDKAPQIETFRDTGKVGAFSQAIRCTRFGGDGHAMLAQVGQVAVETDKTYELSFWAKTDGIAHVSVSIRDTTVWEPVGITRDFSAQGKWRPFHYKFTATRTVHETSRLQFWYTSTGTLWLDDVLLVEVAPQAEARAYTASWLPGRANCLLNSGFELGDAYWFTEGYYKLVGSVVTDPSANGKHCLRIEVDPKRVPVASFDYYDPSRTPLGGLQIAPTYWIEVEPGAEYVFSAWVRASQPIDGHVGVRFTRGDAEHGVRLGEGNGWQRIVLPFKANGKLCCPFIGPTVSDKTEPCTVWIDSLQLEKGGAATAYEPRSVVEVAASTDTWRSVGADGIPAPVPLRLTACNINLQKAADVTVRWTLAGRSRSSADGTRTLHVPAGGSTAVVMDDAAPHGDRPGFANIEVTLGGGIMMYWPQPTWIGGERLPPLRTAAIFAAPATGDTAFGINHAYGWDDWLLLARRLGINWVRDWTLKWQYVEPKRDQFELEKADYFIDRPLKLGMKELCMFPFPSSIWDAETPPKQPPATYERYYQQECAFRPKDTDLFQRYIAKCVDRYRDRIDHWEVFNESIFTSYSLPRAFGYEAEDYVPLLAAASKAVKAADPKATVIGGYSMPPDGGHELYRRFIAKGGLNLCDALSVHEYPGGPPEGSDAPAGALQADMAAAHAPRPMWMTEFAYYADDDPDPGREAFDVQPVDDEQTQAAWTIRYCALMFSRNVTHIFFHIWTSSVGRDSGAALFWKANGEPHKVAPALATMSRLIGPQPRLVQRVVLPDDGPYCLIFERGGKRVAILWDAWDQTTCAGKAPSGRWTDLFGGPMKSAPPTLTTSPVYLETDAPATEVAKQVEGWVK